MTEKQVLESIDSERKEEKNVVLKVYSKPKVTVLGTLQKYTLGGSVGVGDSGGSNFEEPPR